MIRPVTLSVLPAEALRSDWIRGQLTALVGVASDRITGYRVLKRSLDARQRMVRVVLNLDVYIDEPLLDLPYAAIEFPPLRPTAPQVVIVGAGPAGLFAALQLIQQGIKPILLERGKDVRSRRRDLAALNKQGVVDPNSNYCFGEGGAGTYSDGKLFTRSQKRGNLDRILHLFVQFGASSEILVDAHPHIGTNKLPGIITSMREAIEAAGGEIHFESRMSDLTVENGEIRELICENGTSFRAHAYLLATGHSARDVFHLFHKKSIRIEAKPFALGVRVEHPQDLIDQTQYHCALTGDPLLPPAAYSWVEQVADRGVFSFCMCPGGIIAPAATAAGEIVVNGWSPSKRNNPYANSGIVVSVNPADCQTYQNKGPLAVLAFQQEIEQKAFQAGGGKLMAPALRLTDFCEGKISTDLPHCSYLPGIRPADLTEILPTFIHTRLQEAFRRTGRKMKGYYTKEAVVVATESRTSSPVRIPRDQQKLNHPEINNLYPCGEGSGYAGGIISAAMDGERVALAIAAVLTET
ncbi:MAG: FAD-binding protein [Bacteroidetes bacterium]|nr:FAD-binding protein [Bacteroidota bacterium]